VAEELDQILAAAEAELTDLVQAELLATARLHGTNPERPLQHSASKLEAALDRWSRHHIDELAKFAERLEFQRAARTYCTPAAWLAALDPPISAESPASVGPTRS